MTGVRAMHPAGNGHPNRTIKPSRYSAFSLLRHGIRLVSRVDRPPQRLP